jgi:hypothetical protein
MVPRTKVQILGQLFHCAERTRPINPTGYSPKAFCIVLTVCSISLVNSGCQVGRISGTYVAHGPNFASMLQLTQTDGGQITGALDETELRTDGKLHSDRIPITSGMLDGGQLTLSVHPGPFGTNIGGTIEWNTIRLQAVGSKGEVLSWSFQRSSAAEFKAYADELKVKADGLVLSAALLRQARELHQIAQTAERWIANAELHAQRIPGVKDYYQKLENKMRSLVARERATPNSVAKGQISVSVSQGDVAGTQTDIQVDQTWDRTIGDTGRNLRNEFATYPSDCGIRKELQKRGATGQAIEAWESACQEAAAERAKFEPVIKRIMEQRAELKAFQTTAESHRRALVDEAGRIQ